jgi:transposase
VHPVYIPGGGELQLRQLAKHYVRMVRERARAIQRLRALFLESGVRIGRKHSSVSPPIRRLVGGAAKAIAGAYVRQIRATTELVDDAKGLFIHAAQQFPAYEILQSIPYIGEMRAAMLIAAIGNPDRFTSRRKFWAYGGLAVVQNTSTEHHIENGQIVRTEKSRGIRLSKSAQPLLKKLLRDIALHASVRRGPFREIYDSHIARGKRPSIARLALARKIAAIVLAMWRSGDPFNPSLLTTQKNSFGVSIERACEPAPSIVVKATALTICRPEELCSKRLQPKTG